MSQLNVFAHASFCTWNASSFLFIWLISVHLIKLSLGTILFWRLPCMRCSWFIALCSPCADFWHSSWQTDSLPIIHLSPYSCTLPRTFAALSGGGLYFPWPLSMGWPCDLLYPVDSGLTDDGPISAWTSRDLVTPSVLEPCLFHVYRLGCPVRRRGSTWRRAEPTPRNRALG